MQIKTILITALGLGNLAVAQDLLTVLSGIKETRDFFNRINNDPILKPIFETVKNVTVVAPLDAALRAIKGSEVVIHKDKGKGGKGDKDKSGQQSQPPDQLARSQVIYHILDGIYPQSAINNIPQFIPTKVVSQGGSAAGNATGGQEQSFLRNQTVPSNVTFANVEGSQVVKADKAGKSVRFTGGLNVAGKVTKGDIRFDGGVIHVIDHALPSPQTVTDTLRAANLTQLLGAIHQTGLQDLFDFLPNITVFAPRNESFNKISNVVNTMSIQQSKVKGTIKQIDTDLANILRYTIGRGVYYSTHLNNLTIPSLVSDGQELLTNLIKGNGFINSAKAVSTDLLTNNGVIHVIDNVLNPQNVTAPPSGNAKSGSVMFANASNGHANLAQNVGINNKPIPLPAATPITPVPRPAATPNGTAPAGSPSPTPAGSPTAISTPSGGSGGAGGPPPGGNGGSAGDAPPGGNGGSNGGGAPNGQGTGPSRAKHNDHDNDHDGDQGGNSSGTPTQSQSASKTSSHTHQSTGPFQTNGAAFINEGHGTVAALVGAGALFLGL